LTTVVTTPPAEATIAPLDRLQLKASVGEILSRHAAVGLALGVVRNGALEFFHAHGYADVATKTPITPDTVFRICSLTKLFTAVAVMQLWEQGQIDLDAPANDYLRAYQLIPANPSWRPATVRHLLTHTSGIPEVLNVRDLLHPDWGKFEERPAVYSVKLGEHIPSLAEYYGPGPRIDAEPGTAFQYCNHGFATLGQIVADVSGTSVERYLREHILEPLGMADTEMVRAELVKARLATGYNLERTGAKAVTDREWVTVGATNIYSNTRDMARFVAALLGGGTNAHGSILKATTLATMFEPHYQPDPRLPGMGLAFFRGDAGGHRVVSHDGVEPGFHTRLSIAPDDGVGVIAFTNGSSGAMLWLPDEVERLLQQLLDVPGHVVRSDVPQHPEIWEELCGVYRARFLDLRQRVMMGGGVKVFVRGGQLMVRLLTPIPHVLIPLHPDDERDPYVFRIDLSRFGMGTGRVVFSRERGVGATAVHTDVGMLSFYKRPGANWPSAWLTRALPALLVAATAVAVRRRVSTSLSREGNGAHGRR
jgi:CubicO group peptidase (beta-lactamase class C family)